MFVIFLNTIQPWILKRRVIPNPRQLGWDSLKFFLEVKLTFSDTNEVQTYSDTYG